MTDTEYEAILNGAALRANFNRGYIIFSQIGVKAPRGLGVRRQLAVHAVDLARQLQVISDVIAVVVRVDEVLYQCCTAGRCR